MGPCSQILCDQCCSTGQEKRAFSYALTPPGLELSVTLLPTNHWGFSPTEPLHWPKRSITVMGHTSEICFPFRLLSHGGYLLRAREQGQAWNGGVGPRWWGAAPIHFRTVTDRHCLSSHPVTYHYQTTGWHSEYFSMQFFTSPYWVCGLGVKLAHAHFICKHTLFLYAKTHWMYKHSHHYRHFSENLHIRLREVLLFLKDCVWEGLSHRQCLHSPCEIRCRLWWASHHTRHNHTEKRREL